MVLAGVYTWKETSTHVHVRCALKGASPKSVDVYASDLYAKLSYAPYLIELDLLKEVEPDGAKARIRNGELTVSIPKKAQGETWGSLVLAKGSLPKKELLERREAAKERRAAREKEIGEKAIDRRYEDDRTALRKQMVLDETERSTVDDRKAAEKEVAEQAMYERFKEVKLEEMAIEKKANDDKRAAQAAERDAMAAEVGADGGFDLDDAPPVAAAPPKKAVSFDKPAAAPEPPAPPPAPVRVKQNVVGVSHTPRVFPTPMRESKLKEEHQWISKNRQHLHKNKMLFGQNIHGKDGRTIEEADPSWLKSKADTFFASGDLASAISAYSAALELDPQQAACLANRAACHLKLRNYDDCAADCTKGLDLPADDVKPGLRVKYRARRAAARCGLGDYAGAASDFRAGAAAADAASDDARRLHADADRADALHKAAEAKARGDGALGKGDAAAAVAAYGDALDAEPAFVSALANRAAARLALGDVAGAVDDCGAALDIFEHDESGDARAAGPVPPVGSEKRRTWVLRTLARRGAALARLDRLKDAVADYETACAIAPEDEKLRADLVKLQEALAAAPPDSPDGAEEDVAGELD